jgi:hypothetical protein
VKKIKNQNNNNNMWTSYLLVSYVSLTTLTCAAQQQQQCTAMKDPTLCGSEPLAVTPIDTCADGSFNFAPMPPCCRIQSETKPCLNPPPESGSVSTIK